MTSAVAHFDETFVRKFIHMLDKTNGRDKLYRTIIYGSRLLRWTIQKTTGVEYKFLKIIEDHLSDSRKVFRLLKWLSNFRALVVKSLPSTFLEFVDHLRHFSLFVYYLYDQFIWMAKIGLVRLDRKALGLRAGKWWLLSLICGICLNVSALQKINQKLDQEKAQQGVSLQNLENPNIRALLAKRQTESVKIVKNIFDSPLAVINANGWKDRAGPGFIGFFGLVSSLAGMRLQWP
eukprot:CAMPEP_0119133422 /NCGR_PEP_ID=MMETSP1310-20130426/13365_1 /TAXON_ID=464262 /ORGANISM="Genus nov. species nov., Strain RCC2339" /LENGTH=233 /DNA_ID=CAMNT_0007124111 /DNA_START=27 /DNA_END=724 /DNA_ORIENTATION=+